MWTAYCWLNTTLNNTCYIFSEFYLKHFEKFLEDFGINFVRDECVENGIDNLETFLMLEKDDFMNVLGLNLGNTLKCMKAQKKFSELESWKTKISQECVNIISLLYQCRTVRLTVWLSMQVTPEVRFFFSILRWTNKKQVFSFELCF